MFEEDRLKAQILTGKNIVVEAGAGTGKTTLLIARLCLSLLVQKIPPEKLVALTFTDKAAAEIKTRLTEQLQQVIGDIKNKAVEDAAGGLVFNESLVPDPKKERTLWLIRTHFAPIKYEELLARAQAAKNNLDRANIGTIHSFCGEILKLFPLEAGIAPDCAIDAGQNGGRLFEDRWNDFLDSELGTQAPHPEAWAKVLPEISLEELKAFAKELCNGKIEHYDYYAQKDLVGQFCEEKARQALEMSTAYLPSESSKPRGMEKWLLWAEATFRRSAEFLRTGKITPAVPQEGLSKEPGSTLVIGWDQASWDQARVLIKSAQAISPEHQEIFLTAYGLVAPLVAQVRAQYQERGLLSFDDLLVKTRNLVRNHPEVRNLLKEKFAALFIDEFQDTDPVQGEFFLFLAEEKGSSACCWQQVRLEPGKLFVVGDPKQSIYRFRGADITAYQLFTDLILQQGGEKCFLRENHRSLPEIIETANAVCALAMQEEPHYQPAYVPIFTTKQTRNHAVSWMFIENGGDVTQYRHNQAEQIARWIKQNVGKTALQNGRLMTYKDIALLIPVNNIFPIYVEAFRRWHIPFNVESDLAFLRSQEVNDFIVLLRALSNPEDKTALAGVLRSPFGGFNDEEIYQVVKRGELSLHAHTQDEKLKNFYAQLVRLAQFGARNSVQKLLRFILDETFFPEACMAAYNGVRTTEYLEQIVGLLQRYPQGLPVPLETFIADTQQLQQAMQQQYRSKKEHKELKIVSFDEASDAVSLMTVHKSKGLEAPVVILCDVCRADSADKPDVHLYSWKYGLHGLSVGKFCDANMVFLQEERRKHSRCEQARVMYVSLTRAKEKMLLFGDARDKAEKVAAKFAAAGLFPEPEQDMITKDALEIPVIRFEGKPTEDFIYQMHEEQERETTSLAVTAWQAAHQARQAAYAEAVKDKKQIPSGGEKLFSPEQRAGAELGTICHRVLERLLSGGGSDLAALCRAAAQAAQAPQRAAQSEALLAPFLQSDLFRTIRACRVLACEMPFSVLLEDGTLETGTMDAVLELPDGSVWVLDYKTDRVRAGQEQKTLREQYARQLGAYQKAAQQIFAGKPVRTSAVFVRNATAADL